MGDRLRRQADQLVAAFPEGEIAEPPLHLHPFVALGGAELVRAMVERLVQHRHDDDRRVGAARRGFRERLQEVNVAPARLLRGVLERLAGLVHDQQQPGAGRVGD